MTLIILLYALFASSFSIGKVLVGQTTPIFLTGARMLLGGVILLLYQRLWSPSQFRFKKKHLWLFIQLVFFGVYINYIFRFWALNYLPSSKTCFLYNFSPFLSSFYLYLLYNERMTNRQWGGLIIGFLGMIPILLSSSQDESLMGSFLFISLPEFAVLLSVATHSYSWIVLRKLVRDKQYDPTMANGLSMTTGGLLALMTSFFIEGVPQVADVSTFSFWLCLATLISNIICYNLYAFLLRQYTPTFLSFAGFLAPLFAAFYGWAFLGEIITWHFYVSACIVFSGLYIFYKDEMKNIADKQSTCEL